MRILKNGLLSAIALALLTYCAAPAEQKSEMPDEPETPQGITLTKAPSSPAYAEASLSLTNYSSEEAEEGFVANMEFEVTNYGLGVQTEGSDTRGIANSGKGQHIHLILNNGPYSAHYEPTASKPLEEGNYVALAFLSRSYHESVKNENSYWLDVIKVGEPEEELNVDFTAPHLFYSRPKGTYVGKDTEKLMIDFFLLNTTLSPEGNKVKATVNGEVFLIDEWAPFYVEGLPLGEIMVKLELIDADGEVIPGPFNVVERKVMLEAAKEEI
jgi:hypothetical protein